MSAHVFPVAGAMPSSQLSADAWPLIGGAPACFFAEFDLPSGGEPDLGPLRGARLLLFGGVELGTYQGQPAKWPRFMVVELDAEKKLRRQHYLAQGADYLCAYSSGAEHKRVAGLPPSDHRFHGEDPEWMRRFEFDVEILRVLSKALKIDRPGQELADQAWLEFNAAGPVKNQKEWLRARLLPEFKWLRAKPRWVQSEGAWPVAFGRQMLFVGQSITVDNLVTKAHGLAGKANYLFAGWSGPEVEFKIISQDATSQTAEQHYLIEELIALYSVRPNDPKTISRCLKEGDAHVHGFMLEHRKTSQPVLLELNTKGASKGIRTEAGKLLKQRAGK